MDNQSAQAARHKGKAAKTLHDRELTYLPVASLKLRKNNPRTHSPKQIRQIADSIETFGFTNPVLIDRDGNIVAGHGRFYQRTVGNGSGDLDGLAAGSTTVDLDGHQMGGALAVGRNRLGQTFAHLDQREIGRAHV